MTDIQETLTTRGKRYGQFKDHAALSMGMKQIMRSHDNYDHLPPYMQEAIDMILHKLARVVNGDAYYIDSWRDCIGYIQLVIDELQVDERATDAVVSIVNTHGDRL